MNTLNAIEIFGYTLDWTLETALFWLLVAQVVLVVFLVIVFAVLLRRIGRIKVTAETEAKPTERTLTGLSLDVSMVTRTFGIGDAFECDGLIITAEYSGAPQSEIVQDYAVMDQATLDSLEKNGKVEGCYVLIPDLSTAGKKNVTVHFHGMTAVYVVEAAEKEAEPAPAEQPAAVAPVPAEEPAPERTLLYVTLNTETVKKSYTAGEALSTEGLAVTAHFNTDPQEVQVDDFTVIAPEMGKAGTFKVSVIYQDKAVGYDIEVAEPEVEPEPAAEEPVAEETVQPAEEPVIEEHAAEEIAIVEEPVFEEPAEPVAEEVVRPVVEPTNEPLVVEEEWHEGGTLRYDRSFTARLIQTDEETKAWYSELKNELLSYKKVHDRMSWKRETYRIGRFSAARFSFRGKTLCLYLPLNTADYAETKYKVEDASENVTYADTPCMYRLKNAKRVRYAKELIAIVMEQAGAVRYDRPEENYVLPYEGIVELLNKGLVKHNVKEKKDESIFYGEGHGSEAGKEVLGEVAASDSEPAIIIVKKDPAKSEETVPAEGKGTGPVGYDRSFTARLIQSDDSSKQWYTLLKNELLSYKKVHDRMSWKRETYRIGKDTAARFSFRGKTLCLYLPLDPADYADTKYRVEDVSENANYVDTPCLYRIKNTRRQRYAVELITATMEKLGTVKGEHESVDYYVPYEGVAQLVQKGLIKRVVKDAGDAASSEDDEGSEE